MLARLFTRHAMPSGTVHVGLLASIAQQAADTMYDLG